MKEGEVYPIEVRYALPSGGLGSFDVQWSWSGQSANTVGRESLRHSSRQETELKRAWR